MRLASVIMLGGQECLEVGKDMCEFYIWLSVVNHAADDATSRQKHTSGHAPSSHDKVVLILCDLDTWSSDLD